MIIKPSDLKQMPVESEIIAFNEFMKANWNGKSVQYFGTLSPTTVLALQEYWEVTRQEPDNHSPITPHWRITEKKYPTHHKRDE
jgi:hypothetical protein